MIRAGDRVQFKALPPGVAALPPESQAVFAYCLGRTYRVTEIDGQGLFVLDVSPDIDPLFGGYKNDIRVEAECLERAGGDVSDEDGRLSSSGGATAGAGPGH